MVSIGREYTPVGEHTGQYSEIYESVYKPFYGRVKDLIHNLSVITNYP